MNQYWEDIFDGVHSGHNKDVEFEHNAVLEDNQMKVVMFNCGCKITISPDNEYRLWFCRCHNAASGMRHRLQQIKGTLGDYAFWKQLSNSPLVPRYISEKLEEVIYQIGKLEVILKCAGDETMPDDPGGQGVYTKKSI